MKKIIYLILWVLAGSLIGFLSAGAIELKSILLLGELTLESVLYGILIFLGAVFGLAIGPIAWRKIYVEGLRGKKYTVRTK